MATIAEALQEAASAVNAAAARLNLLRDNMAAQIAAVTAAAQAKIDQFIGRPGIRRLYVDPVNGLDTNPGTLAAPLKDLDAVLYSVGVQFTLVYLLADTTIRKRHEIYAPFIIYGIQRAANATGFIFVDRQLSFLPIAENSPNTQGETSMAGITLYGQNYQSGWISYRLPSLGGGLTLKTALNSNVGTGITIVGGTTTVESDAAGALIGSSNLKIPAYLSTTLGAGVAGHLFSGVAAGQNPNSLFQYSTNITTG